MNYLKISWFHERDSDPTVIFVEVDDERWEHRKLEVFESGRQGFACSEEEVNGSVRGEEPWPDFSKLGSEPEFEVVELAREEFERVWSARRAEIFSG